MQLLSQAKKPNRKAAESAIVTLKDLFVQNHLTPVTKLHVFTKHPVILSKRDACSKEEIMQAYYEHCLREIMRDLIAQVLQ